MLLRTTRGIYWLSSVTMLLFLSNRISRKVGNSSRAWVRAFSSTHTAAFTSSKSTRSINSNRLTCSSIFEDTHVNDKTYYSTTTNLFDSSGVAEQDLDSALDDLLAGTFDGYDDDDNNEPEDVVDARHMKDSKPIPSALVEEVCHNFRILCHNFCFRLSFILVCLNFNLLPIIITVLFFKTKLI